MLEPPRIVETPAQIAAVIHLTIPRAEIGQAMGPAIGEVMAAVAAQGIEPSGPVFSHHVRMHPDTFDFDVGIPIATPVSAVGRVKLGHLPAATVARTFYVGPYEGLSTAWPAFQSWIAAHGHTAAANLWESYVAGPESDPDPSTWRTELNQPLIG